MSLLKHTSLRHGTNIIIWKIENNEEELKQGLTWHKSDYEKFGKFRRPVRQNEFLALRQCLRYYFGSNPEVNYTTEGKPYLQNGYHISFSHTHGYAALILSDKLKVGIDLECCRKGIHNIRSRFMRPEEEKTLSEETLAPHLTAYWGAKEVIVKITGNRKLDFKKQMRITPFLFKDRQSTSAYLLQKNETKRYQLFFKKQQHMVLTYGWQLN